MARIKKKWCRFHRDAYFAGCLGLFEALHKRTNVCPACYAHIRKLGLTIQQFILMTEKYTEQLLSWDTETQTGDVKVTRTETVDINGRQNTHSNESMFTGTTLLELEEGLKGLGQNKETIDKKLQETQNKITQIKTQIAAAKGSIVFTEELLDLERKVHNIGMLREIEKLKVQSQDHKTAVKELDEKILARGALLNQIRGQ
jgi:predicted RNase H-like nuclease (RuvC/YqgF family)